MPPPSSRSASPAADIAAALGARAEAVCRRYLPQGRKQGRYWVAGDLEGARGRSLFVRLHGPGVPGKWTDAATGEHGDLLDLVRHRSGAPTLRAALAEARAFLALPAPPASGESYDATEAARRLWRRCRAIGGTHAEAYLRARGLARCRFPALRFHPELRYREGSSLRRFPALVAAVTGDDGAIHGVQRTWLDPRLPAKADVAAPRKALGRIHGRAVRFGRPAADASLLVGEGIETVLSIRHRGARGHFGGRALGRKPRRLRSAWRAQTASSSPGTTIPRANGPPNASPGAARGRASPPTSSSPNTATSTTISLHSDPGPWPFGSPPCSVRRSGSERGSEERGRGERIQRRKGAWRTSSISGMRPPFGRRSTARRSTAGPCGSTTALNGETGSASARTDRAMK